jgi:hypothetical protein
MIRKSINTAVVCLILGFAVSIANDGCRPTCDSIPNESTASVRILNAVSNVDILLIYIDGKLFDRAYYNLADYSNAGLNFTYRGTYISDGSPLTAGQHHIVAIASGAGASADTVLQSDLILYNHLQSIECIGKLNGTPAQKPTTVYLDDVLRSQQVNSYARFVDAVPDISGMDVYFNSIAIPPPNIRMHYGKISDAQGGDSGTGLSANDYFEFPLTVNGLIITPIGDTSQADYIANSTYSLPTTELLVTIVVRGETKPSGKEPTISTLVIEDGIGGGGTYNFELQTSEIRLVNASHYPSMSLMIANPNDKNDSVPRTTTNKPYATQEKVTNITQDSVSNFMGLNPNEPYYKFWFASSDNNSDTVLRFTTDQHDSLTRIVIPTLLANGRYTFVAIDTIKDDPGNSGLTLLELLDTVSSPSDSTMERVCFVNTTADYTANFTFGGQSFKMKQRDVGFIDVPLGAYNFQVTDAGTSGTVSFNVVAGMPTTVFFMPSQPGNPVPYSVSTQ